MALTHRPFCHKALAILVFWGFFNASPWASAAWARDYKIATWNLNWLTLRQAGDPALPKDVTVRAPGDFDRLRGYAEKLDADVVAFQEVDGAIPAARLFPPDRYDLAIADGNAVQKTGFAIRHGIAWHRNPDLAALDLAPDAPHPLRNGTDITVDLNGRPLRLLDVHLKTGCWSGPLATATRACETLARQLPMLADWVRARAVEGGAYVLLGDFNRRLDTDPATALLPSDLLTRAEAGTISPCWGGEAFIDHIFLGGAARHWLEPASLHVMVYRETDPVMKEHLSDHCAVSVRLQQPPSPPPPSPELMPP